MKILLLNHNQIGYGTYWRVYFLAKNLANQGFKVTMIAASGSEFDSKIRVEKITQNFDLLTLPRLKFGKYWSGQEYRLLLTIVKILRIDYDILHAFTVAQPQIALPALIGKWLKKKKLIVDWDDAWHQGFTTYHSFPVKNILNYCELKTPLHADFVTVSSDFLHEKAVSLGIAQDKIAQIPNGCNSEDIIPISKYEARKKLNLKDEKILVSMGHTYADTMDFMLDTYDLVLKKYPATKLFLLSKLNLDESLKKRISNTGNIIMTGEIPFEKFKYYLSAADIFLLPMKDTNIEKARFPIRFGDYLCAGRPIVSNAVGMVKKIIEQESCGIVSSVDNPKEMSDSIIWLINNPKQCEEMGIKSRQVAEGILAWENITKKLSQIYEKLG
ncbi:glycoprotein 3-alpha-L-fucosyltransferase [Marine Group I thaumarchaeote SCGC AAA799-B03]|uniref:Glycoprotein 3-alpha-L-fucosyltransferase n=1 Tax=Marine Group I thaumarchaeote SCGC AAA799-B03 TaxID=1502289 RepID=A0A087S911_9ARCH|nr:glycoprotein 3-alpha-L-fucosyltransferase [Marine Group I thaumarchaeote SCGC AAA799-B03]